MLIYTPYTIIYHSEIGLMFTNWAIKQGPTYGYTLYLVHPSFKWIHPTYEPPSTIKPGTWEYNCSKYMFSRLNHSIPSLPWYYIYIYIVYIYICCTYFILCALPFGYICSTWRSQDWLRCIEGPPGPVGGTPINVVNLSSRLMARWDEPEASGNPGGRNAGEMCISTDFIWYHIYISYTYTYVYIYHVYIYIYINTLYICIYVYMHHIYIIFHIYYMIYIYILCLILYITITI